MLQCENMKNTNENEVVEQIAVADGNVFLPSVMEKRVFCGDDVPEVGEIIHLSSCEIGWHNVLRDTYQSQTPYWDDIFADVVLELVDVDDTDYIPEKSHDGGAYLYSYWKIVAVENILKFEDI